MVSRKLNSTTDRAKDPYTEVPGEDFDSDDPDSVHDVNVRQVKTVFPLLDPTVSFRSKCIMVGKTVALVNVWINMGMAISVTSTTLPDMLPRVNGDYETITRAGSFGAIGSIGGFALGMICDKFSKWQDLVMSFALILSSVTTVMYPWTRSLVQYGANNMIYFIAYAVQNTVGNYMIANLWGEHTNGPMHFMHLGFGIGSFICPLIAQPFLSPDVVLNAGSNSTENVSTTMTPTVVLQTTPKPNLSRNDHEFSSQIEVPYAILGGYGLICALSFIGLQIIGPPKTVPLASEKTDELISKQKYRCIGFFSPGNWANGDIVFGLIMVIGMCLFYFGLNGCEGPLRYFIFAFAIESQLKFSKPDAALLDSMFNLAYTVGRFVAGVFSMFIPIQIVLFIALTGVLVATGGMSLLLTTPTHLWVFACLFGFMSGPNWPAGMSWANRYITVTASFGAWLGIVPVLAKFGMDWIVGHLFQNVSPYSIMYLSFGFAGFVLFIMIGLQIIASRHGSRYGDKMNSNSPVVVTDSSDPDEKFDDLSKEVDTRM